ncbi:MAG: rRNA maturation RNase YbeY [Proteobacteria bacterium]|nr:rRNA maturation RNase YbeY [Pseudomonadota bacterium]
MSVVSMVVRPGLNPSMVVGRCEARDLAQRVLAALGMDSAELELTLTDDREMARLHQSTLGRTGPTNGLAFNDEDPERPDYLGEVVISVDTLARECELYGQPPLEHMARLMAHSFLHLAGMDHSPEMDDFTEAAVDAVAGCV